MPTSNSDRLGIWLRSEKTVQLLLEKGADIDAQGRHFGNALQAAAAETGNEKTIQSLLEEGADVTLGLRYRRQ